jgi:choline kinase
MKAIILAAGACRRLMPLTENQPKCLIKIADKTILEHQLDAIIHAGIRKAVIVVGYLKEMIMDFVGETYKDICKIVYIENREYASTNTVYSLYLTRDQFINDDFIYFNADVLFHKDVVKLLVDHNDDHVLAVDYKKCAEEEVKFKTNAGGRVTDLGKKIALDEAEGEFIGVAKFGRGISKHFINALEYYSINNEKNLFFEKAVNDILDMDNFIPLDVSNIPNIEIDFPEDLQKAKNEVYPAIVEYDKSKNKNQ